MAAKQQEIKTPKGEPIASPPAAEKKDAAVDGAAPQLPKTSLLPELGEHVKSALEIDPLVRSLKPEQRVAYVRGLLLDVRDDVAGAMKQAKETGFPGENIIGKLLVTLAKVHGIARVTSLFREAKSAGETNRPPKPFKKRGRGGRMKGGGH